LRGSNLPRGNPSNHTSGTRKFLAATTALLAPGVALPTAQHPPLPIHIQSKACIDYYSNDIEPRKSDIIEYRHKSPLALYIPNIGTDSLPSFSYTEAPGHAAQHPKIRRLRASETTFKAKVTPQAQPISKTGRVAIRLRFVCYTAFSLLSSDGMK